MGRAPGRRESAGAATVMCGDGFRLGFAFEGYTPVRFLKSAQVIDFVMVAALRETGVRKPL